MLRWFRHRRYVRMRAKWRREHPLDPFHAEMARRQIFAYQERIGEASARWSRAVAEVSLEEWRRHLDTP